MITNYGQNETSDETPQNTGENQTYSRNEKDCANVLHGPILPLGRSIPRQSNTVKHDTKHDTTSNDTTNFTTSEVKARVCDLILSLDPAERETLMAELLEIFGAKKEGFPMN